VNAMDEREVVGKPTHPSSAAKYVFALVALIVLTLLSLVLHYAGLGAAGTPIALSIAGIKVVIVGLIFMELLVSLAATRMIAIVTILYVALLCFGIIGDVAFR